jgi:multidrug efflux pump subunit AcrA (membrane-fusion protein)
VGSFFVAKGIVDSKKSFRPKAGKVVKTVFTEVVKNGTVPIVVSANGNLSAKQRVELYAEVQGVFRRGSKLFKEGQAYRAGETIISIDASEYAASVQSAKSNLYNELTSIMPDFDMSKSTPAFPEMTSEKERFFISGRGILTNYYNVKNLEQRLSKYRIVAPFAGILTEASVTEGSLVRAGQKLGEFINPGVYELEVSVSKTYTDLLKVGESVELSTLDQTKTYTGKVSRINGRVDQATQTIKAYIEVNNPNLREGMYLEAYLDARKEDNAIEIDRSLLMEGDRIFVVRDSVLDVINVKPVYFSDKRVVLKDVPNGATIMSKPLIGAYTGMAVKVFKDQPANTKG